MVLFVLPCHERCYSIGTCVRVLRACSGLGGCTVYMRSTHNFPPACLWVSNFNLSGMLGCVGMRLSFALSSCAFCLSMRPPVKRSGVGGVVVCVINVRVFLVFFGLWSVTCVVWFPLMAVTRKIARRCRFDVIDTGVKACMALLKHMPEWVQVVTKGHIVHTCLSLLN